MIIGPDYVFIESPKVASNTISRWLISKYKGRRHNCAITRKGRHNTIIPAGCEEKFCFTFVRNPYDLAVSQWAWTVKRSIVRGKRIPFSTFTKSIRSAEILPNSRFLGLLEMVIGNDYVFIEIPKTGTNTLEWWLKKYYEGRQWRKHNVDIRHRDRDKFKFAVVREPYDRAVSMWYSTCMRRDNAGTDRYGLIRSAGGDEFWRFAKLFKTRSFMDHKRQVWCRPQAEYVLHASLDAVYKFEELEESLKQLPFYKPGTLEGGLPRLNPSTGRKRDYRLYYDKPEIIEWINEYAADDFEQFGYQKWSPDMAGHWQQSKCQAVVQEAEGAD